MIVQCADCKSRYRLQPELVPPQQIKVRCMRCDHVFAIDGREAGSPAPEAPVAAPAVDPSRFGELSLDSRSLSLIHISEPTRPY